ncbi:MAG: hypothetical protein Q4F34_01415 [Prevotellaceae bacterium]|nr:hypothetical protein [Prevotellaceae bacterium]
MTKTKNLWIVGILALVVGYFLGDFVGIPAVNGDMLSGDVAKADLYKGQKVDPDMAAIVEKLQSDTAFCNLTSRALTALKERVDGAQALAERTSSMCSDVPEMQKVLGKIESLQAKAYNAALSLEKANAELKKIANGEKSDIYEQASNNAFICYSKAEGQVNVGKEVFTTINSYLKGKKGPEADEMAQLATDWSKYCIEDAAMNGSKEDLEFWNSNLANANEAIAEHVADLEQSLGFKLGKKIDFSGDVVVPDGVSGNMDVTMNNLSTNDIQENLKNIAQLGKFVPKKDEGGLGMRKQLDPVFVKAGVIAFPQMSVNR